MGVGGGREEGPQCTCSHLFYVVGKQFIFENDLINMVLLTTHIKCLRVALLLVSCNYLNPPPSYFLRTILQTIYSILLAVIPMFLQQRRHFQFPTRFFSFPKIDIFNDFQRQQLLNHSLQLCPISIFQFRTTFHSLSIQSA